MALSAIQVAALVGAGVITSGQGGGVALTKQQVVTNFNVPDFLATGTTTSTNNRQVIRLTRYAGGEIMADLQASLSSYYVTSTGELAGAAYTARLSFEIGGVVVVATKNGSQDIPVASGDVDVLTDPIQPSAFGLASIPDQSVIYVKFERLYAEGVTPTYWYSGSMDTQANNLMIRGGAATTASVVGSPGPLVQSSAGYGSAVTSYFAPSAILGKFRKGSAVGTVVVGASIENGANASPSDGTGATGGYIRRGFVSGKYRSYICLAVGGETAADYLARRAKRGVFEKYGDAAMSGFGGNDFSGGTNPTTIIANNRSVNALLKAQGAKVGQIRMSPKSNSTDSWASVDGSNQTVRTVNTFYFLDTRAAVEAAAAADLAAGLIDLRVDCTPAIETGPNTGLWKGTGVANAVTTDGTHPSNLRHGEMAVSLAPQADALIELAKAA